MIRELIAQLKSWLQRKAEAAAALLTPGTIQEMVPDENAVLVASDGNVLDMGKRYRRTSGHAPLFSLYTFFTRR
jgi:hypothetical protein